MEECIKINNRKLQKRSGEGEDTKRIDSVKKRRCIKWLRKEWIERRGKIGAVFSYFVGGGRRRGAR